MKRITAVMLTAAMLCGYSAAEAKDEIKVYYDGAQIEFDTVPEIVNERTFVPLRAIAETLGADVAWDGSKDMVTLSRDDVETYLIIGSDETKTKKDEKTTSGRLDAAPYIKDERTMVPVRFISETFGMDVDWDGETLSVLINQPKQTDEPTEVIAEATAEPTEEPTAEPAAEQLTDDERYAKAYEGTRYKFVQNVPEMTSDFESKAKNIKTEKHSDIGKDINGNGVLYIQKDRRSGETAGNATIFLKNSTGYDSRAVYDISFDLYCPPANGSVTVDILDTDEVYIGRIMILERGGKCLVGEEKDTAFESMEYFNNNTDGNDEDVIPANGAHVNILLDMMRRRYTVTVTGVENGAEPHTVAATFNDNFKSYRVREAWGPEDYTWTGKRDRFLGLKFATLQEGMSMPVIVDNLVTNLVEDTILQ